METLDAALLAERAPALFFYSPYNFLREISAERQQQLFGTGRMAQLAQTPGQQVFSRGEGPARTQLLYGALPWDSAFFGTPTYKLHTGVFGPGASMAERLAAVQALRAQLAANGRYYCFSEVPTEDTDLLQMLTGSGWRLVETRLLFYLDAQAAEPLPRHAVRLAAPAEAAHIGTIAATARNPYDRFHADSWFGPERADAFLARYASAAVQGYCDAVLVPAENEVPVDSFLAISDLAADAAALGVGLSRVVLTAVGPLNRGWHLRLVTETVRRAQENGSRYVLMTTQATNRAVFRTCEKLGFRLGGTSHVLACHGD